MDPTVPPAIARSAESIRRLDARVAAQNYAPLDVVLARGEGEWLWDVDGRRYLDLMSAYSAVSFGHGHPRLVAALAEQARRLAVCSRAYHSDRLAPFLAKLVEVTGLDRALPMNTGAEAVETAIKAARRWGERVRGLPPGRAVILVADRNFHGRTTTIVGFSSEPAYRDGFGPFGGGFRAFAFGDLASLRAAIDADTVAVLVEPIQGEAGVVVPPDGWLREVRALCDAHRMLLIVDEVQSGLGRTGAVLACAHEGVRPDGLVLGKALGGGLLPVSAFVATDELMAMFDPGSHGSTFGGNPLAAAVGLEALRVLEDERLVERSARLGERMLARLRAIRSPLVREVRGRGLWAGVDLDPARCDAHRVCVRMAEAGLLSKDTHGTVIRFAPPLMVAEPALMDGLDVFERVLGDEARAGRRAA